MRSGDWGREEEAVWKDRIYLLTAIPKGGAGASPPPAPAGGGGGGGGRGGREKPTAPVTFHVLAVDRADGRIAWARTVAEEIPHEGHHVDHGFASASAVTDGEMLIASFGSRGIYGLDLAGKVVWEKRLGKMQTRNGFGEGASPALHRETVVIGWDHDGPDDFVVALDRRTGRELWRTKREELTAWATPVIVERPGRSKVILNATARIRSYDLATGKQLWECGGMTANVIPTPIVAGDTAYITSGFRGAALFAIPLGKEGDLSDGASFRWRHDKGTPYVPSPLLYDGALYFASGNNAVLSRVDVTTGKPDFETERIEGVFGLYASMVGASGRVYVAGRDGKTAVLKHGPRLEVLAINVLDDRVDASPALSGRDLFLRGHANLYCLTAK